MKKALDLHWLTFGALSSGFLALFLLSTSFNGEDYAFQKQWSNETVIERMAWAIERSAEQSRNWNARLGEQLSIFWLNSPELIYALAATSAFMLAGYLVGLNSQLSFVGSRAVAVTTALLFALWPSMDIFFWRTANAGYLQPSLFLLLTCSYYLVPSRFERLKQSKKALALVSVAAFLSGLSFENSPIALGALIVTNLVFYKREGARLDRTWLPILGLFVGWLTLVLAPSTLFRVNYYRELFQFPGFTFDYIFKYRIPDVASVFVTSSWILIVLFLAASAALVVRRHLRFTVSVFVGVVVTLVTLVPSPYTEQRAFIFAWFLMIITVARALAELDFAGNISRFSQSSIALIAVCTMVAMIPMYRDFGSQLAARDRLINESVGPACFDEQSFQEIQTDYPYRLLNNRDQWSISTLDQVKQYYGCN